MKTPGQIAFEAAAKVSFCDKEWGEANQEKWTAAAEAAIEHALFSGECHDEQTAFFARLAQGVWDDVRLQGATPREALAMIYRAGGDHRIEAEKLVRSNDEITGRTLAQNEADGA